MDKDSAANDCGRAIQFPEASQLFIRAQHESLGDVAMLVSNPNLASEESTAEPEPKSRPALLRLSGMIY
jgi:hypothetical protein